MWEIYAYQNADSLFGIFNAAATIHGSGDYMAAVAAVAFCGFIAALVAYAFTHLRAARVELITDEENTRSRRVAERCGFTLEGVLRHERRAEFSGIRHAPAEPGGECLQRRADRQSTGRQSRGQCPH